VTDHTLVFVLRIQTFAHLAVKEVIFFRGAAAVTTIPTATTVVIFIITCLIPFPAVFMARSVAFLFVLEFRVQTAATVTIKICCLLPTAVTTVPVTPTVIIFVVTVPISLPLLDVTTSITGIWNSRV